MKCTNFLELFHSVPIFCSIILCTSSKSCNKNYVFEGVITFFAFLFFSSTFFFHLFELMLAIFPNESKQQFCHHFRPIWSFNKLIWVWTYLLFIFVHVNGWWSCGTILFCLHACGILYQTAHYPILSLFGLFNLTTCCLMICRLICWGTR